MPDAQPAPAPIDAKHRHAIESLLTDMYGQLKAREYLVYTNRLSHLSMETVRDAAMLRAGNLHWQLDLEFSRLVLEPANADFRVRLLRGLQQMDPGLLNPEHFGTVLNGGAEGQVTVEEVDEYYVMWSAVLILVHTYGPIPILSPAQEVPLSEYLIANKHQIVNIFSIIRERRVIDPEVINDLLMDGSVLRDGAL